MKSAVPWVIPNMSRMTSIVRHRLFLKAISAAVMTEELMTRWARPGQLLSFNDIQPSRNCLFYSNTRARGILFSPCITDIRVWISILDTPSAVKKCTIPRFSSFTVYIVMPKTHTNRSSRFEHLLQRNGTAVTVRVIPHRGHYHRYTYFRYQLPRQGRYFICLVCIWLFLIAVTCKSWKCCPIFICNLVYALHMYFMRAILC